MTNTYVILMRGINVGGKNKIAMSELKQCLEDQGYQDVVTYINSGNVILRSNLNEESLSAKIEAILPKKFTLDSSIVKILAIKHSTFQAIVNQAPPEFGQDNASYRYDVIFLMGITSHEAMQQIAVRQDIDAAWPGNQAIYYRRPSLTSPNATKSYLGKIAQQPIYPLVTIRNWNTTTKLLHILNTIYKEQKHSGE